MVGRREVVPVLSLCHCLQESHRTTLCCLLHVELTFVLRNLAFEISMTYPTLSLVLTRPLLSDTGGGET